MPEDVQPEKFKTERNKPIAQLTPNEKDTGSFFGRMKGTIHIVGDIMQPIDEVWNVDR
jgi:hypothetical protein